MICQIPEKLSLSKGKSLCIFFSQIAHYLLWKGKKIRLKQNGRKVLNSLLQQGPPTEILTRGLAALPASSCICAPGPWLWDPCPLPFLHLSVSLAQTPPLRCELNVIGCGPFSEFQVPLTTHCGPQERLGSTQEGIHL